ncbi:phage portal protein [Pseudoalteromonas sp. SG43-8]|uniref:phage portal protein n=3 Tax=unclassified Pseudoalteromonas TaxID=194690 RepID=UPI0015FFB780|nr:phage portal protein [Pseudoalteromonas sp. SG43-8]MBB1415338.1 phage portal protein [Pseudoalteromonas sp. SG43-8]
MFSPSMFKTSAIISSMARSFGSGNRTTNSGVHVDEVTAMGNSALNRAITLLATSVGQLNCELYKREGDKRDKATDHPLYAVLRYQPNKKDTAFEYFESGMGLLGLRGNFYALKDHDEKMRVKELIWVHPDNVQVLKGGDGLPYYHLTPENKTVSMDLMHHVKGFSLNGFTGVSPIQTATDSIGLVLATEQHASAVFSQGTTLSGVIERPNEVESLDKQTDIDNVLDTFAARHVGGVRKAFKVAMLQEGMTYRQMSMNNNEAQMIEARKMGILDIARLYGIPPSMLGESAGESYKSVEQTTLNYLVFALMPWLKRWESAMHRDLLLPEERGTYFIEFNFSSLVRGDFKTRYDSYAIGRQWGFLSVNDIRRFENLQPVEGGNEYLTPLNMQSPEDKKAASQMSTATPEQRLEIEKILCRT